MKSLRCLLMLPLSLVLSILIAGCGSDTTSDNAATSQDDTSRYVAGKVDDNDTVVLTGTVSPLARAEYDAGPADPDMPMDRIILILRMDAEKEAALNKLLDDQQNPDSPDYRRWLTPEEFGQRFGATTDEIATVTSWLSAHGFTIDEVAKGRTWINFSGNVSMVEDAFKTKIHKYIFGGEVHYANAYDISIPRALSGLVAGVVSLNDFGIPLPGPVPVVSF